ncbi:MAG: demethoxyubiquinone hydroxylase family protein [Alphaproteobacteria bacterium]
MPGDPSEAESVESMIRVDHAGEFGAVRIYDGQLAVLGESKAGKAIRAMHATEVRHLAAFERLVVERRVRPTALSPLWSAAGFALGVATALMGERAAMAATVAVEEVIDDHYRGQIEALGRAEPALRRMIERFRRDEIRHRDEAIAYGAEAAPGHGLLTAVIKAASRLAIAASTRV